VAELALVLRRFLGRLVEEMAFEHLDLWEGVQVGEKAELLEVSLEAWLEQPTAATMVAAQVAVMEATMVEL